MHICEYLTTEELVALRGVQDKSIKKKKKSIKHSRDCIKHLETHCEISTTLAAIDFEHGV